MVVVVLGASGFVGSAFVIYLEQCPDVEVVGVTRLNYAQKAGMQADIVIDASCNSKKYLADENPVEEFELSVRHRLQTLQDFPAKLQVHISSVDVYSDLTTLETTKEDSPSDLGQVSHYGLHKLLAEQLVRHYTSNWLIIRLAGMVGPGLRKNPAYDILHHHPLRIHPDSQYQFMLTRDVAKSVWGLVQQGIAGQVFNLCGKGLITPREIASLADCNIDLSLIDSSTQPRIVHINTEKIEAKQLLPDTRASILSFISANVAA